MTDIETRRRQLMHRLKELDHRLHEIVEELDEPTTKDWEDAAIEREGDEVLEQLGDAGKREIASIRAALERMRAGEYGACVKCGAGIADERLDLLPDTPFCRACAA